MGNAEKIKVKEEEILPKVVKEEKKEVEQQAPPAPEEEKEVEQQAPPAPEVVKEEKKVKKIDKLPKDEYKASELQNNDKCVAGKDTPKDTGKNVPIETRCPGDYVSIMKCPKILGQKTNFINLTHKNVDGKALFK